MKRALLSVVLLVTSSCTTTVTTTTTAVVTTTMTVPTTTSEAPPSVSTQTRSDESSLFNLVVKTPIVEHVAYSAYINEQVAQVIGQIADAFLVQAAQDGVVEGGGPNNLWIDYQTGTVSQSLVSLELDVSTYVSGAAHPFDVVTTLTYHEGDVFEVIEHLGDHDGLASAIATSIADQFGGTAADVISAAGGTVALLGLAHFLVTDGGIEAVFDQYAVAAGAAGIVRVPIPSQDLTLVDWPF